MFVVRTGTHVNCIKLVVPLIMEPIMVIFSNIPFIYRVYRKKPKFGRFFSCFFDPKFFFKMTLLGLILCGESIARILNFFPDPESEKKIEKFVKNRKIR